MSDGSQFGPGGSGHSRPPWNTQAPAAPPPVPPVGAPPVSAPPPQRPGRGGLVAILATVGVVLLAGLTVLALFLTGVIGGDGGDGGDRPTPAPTTPSGTLGYGTDPDLDALWDACGGGDMGACDDLYHSAPRASEYANYGSTCGQTKAPQFGGCDIPGSFGDDPELDALWTSCEGGEMEDCDTLYWTAGQDTEYESFADTCGGTTDAGHGGACVDIGRNTFGDDPELDALWTSCEQGDYQACNDLYYEAPWDSEYERFGRSCGYRSADRYGDCEYFEDLAYGDSSEKDSLWDACAAGEMDMCDKLYSTSIGGSEYENFGDTCGNTREADHTMNCVRPLASKPGDDPFLDTLYDRCAAGDHDACSRLGNASEYDSEYQIFGETCGGTVPEDDYVNGCY